MQEPGVFSHCVVARGMERVERVGVVYRSGSKHGSRATLTKRGSQPSDLGRNEMLAPRPHLPLTCKSLPTPNLVFTSCAASGSRDGGLVPAEVQLHPLLELAAECGLIYEAERQDDAAMHVSHTQRAGPEKT